MAGSIGIKQANGNFYAILKENSDVKKRLVLTTVHDNQKSVQIDLYRSEGESMTDAVYIGSIVVENILPKPKGDPSIEMILNSTQDGSISAHAVDLANPANEHHLSVSLTSLDEDKNEYPDFEVNETRKIRNRESAAYERKFPWKAVVIAGIVLALLCLALWFFVIRNRAFDGAEREQTVAASRVQAETSPAEKPAAPAAAPVQASAPAQASDSAAAQAAPVQPEAPRPVVVETPPKANPQTSTRERSPEPVALVNAPQTIPPEGITYRIKWGDTLWDISEAFYRNPRLYTFIARSNKLRNPNHIVSGTQISIPSRN
jgi:nucleoid-associated protein YgaU